MMNIGFGAIASLQTIDKWISNVNSNMMSSTRVGYKQNRVKFDGAGAHVSSSGGAGLPTQFGDGSLGVAQTRTDFSQGSVISSTEDTHLAIQGKGFFVLAEMGDATGGALDLNAPNYDYYLSRDGEFHFAINPAVSATDPVLVNSQGLAVMADKAPFNAPFDNLYGFIRKSEWDGAGRIRPSVAETTGGVEPQHYSYSNYGSTVWDGKFQGNRATAQTVVNGSAGNLSSNGSRLIENALEGSNASMSSSVPELALAPKLYSAITKTIVVHQKNLDDVVNLIR